MDDKTQAIQRLQKVCSELAALHDELQKCDLEASRLRLIRDTVGQMRLTAMTLQQGLEWTRLAQDRHGLLALLIDERMRRASQLNIDISQDFEAGRIKLDQEGLSEYLLVLNQLMDKLDVMLGSLQSGG